MTYTQINYIAHRILISKYKYLLHLFIIFIFYSILYEDKILYCMNDNPKVIDTIPRIEVRETNNQAIALINEIKSFAGSQADILAETEACKESLKEEVLSNMTLQFENNSLKIENSKLRLELQNAENDSNHNYSLLKAEHQKSGRLGYKIHELRDDIFDLRCQNDELKDEVDYLSSELRQAERELNDLI